MSAFDLFKKAVAVYAKVPGLPISVPGRVTQYERLPGMTDWASRDVISRLGEGVRQGENQSTLIEAEKNRGLGESIGLGAAVGGFGGGVLGRFMSGEAATAPIRNLLRRGASIRGLRGLAKIPGPAKALALGGAGLGALSGGIEWGTHGQDREDIARSVLRGLRREKLLQSNATQQNQVLKRQLLTENPMPSATAEQPLVANTGKS